MRERDKMMWDLAAVQFAAIDLNLYLDTHCDDNRALECYQEFVCEYNRLKKEYERCYGPLTATANTQDNWQWICDPWPWEL